MTTGTVPATADGPSGIVDRIEQLSRTRRFPAALAAIVVTLHLPAFFLKLFDSDEAYIATVARVMNQGGTLYLDTVDRKPPGVFWLYEWLAAITGSTALWIPRVAGMAAHTVTALLVWRIALRFVGPRAASVAAVLSALSSATMLPADAQSANFEVFMLPLTCAAMLFALREEGVRSGLSLAGATLMKQTAGITILPVLWVLRKRNRLRDVLPVIFGFVVPVVAVAWYSGPSRFWFWVFGGANAGYLDIAGAWNHVLPRLVFMTAVIAVLNCGILAMAWAGRRSASQDSELWLWLGAATIGVFSGTRSFGHYYWQVLPPLCVLAAVGLERTELRYTRKVLSVTAACAGVMMLSAFGMVIAQGRMHYELLASYVRAQTAPNERVFVWGHLPGVFWDSDRLPATRVVTTGFLTGHTSARAKEDVGIEFAVPGIWHDVMADLEAHPPELIIDAVGGEDTQSFDFPMSHFPPMYAYVKLHYHREAVLNDSVVYRRNGHVDPAQTPRDHS